MRPEIDEVGGADGADVGFFVGGVDADDDRAGDGGVLEEGGDEEVEIGESDWGWMN